MAMLGILVGYIGGACALMYILTMGQTEFHRNGVVGWLSRKLQILPQWILELVLTVFCCSRKKAKRSTRKMFHYLCDVRHPLMQIMYLALIGGAVFFYFRTVYPMFTPWLQPGPGLCIHHFSAPLVTGIAFWCYVQACRSDPGVVTAENVADLVKVYDYDEALYFKGSTCPTCVLKKPPRSKHCRVCNHCVAKFDHHCGWINNDVGAKNYVWFQAFLLSHVALCSYGAVLCWRILRAIYYHHRMWQAQFTTATGEVVQPTWTVLFQYMVQEYTVVSGEFVFLSFVAVLLLCFLVYHWYLTACNMTTNETFKLAELKAEHGWYEKAKARREALGVPLVGHPPTYTDIKIVDSGNPFTAMGIDPFTLVINRVDADGVAHESGVRTGMRVAGICGTPVSTREDVDAALRKTPTSEPLVLRMAVPTANGDSGDDDFSQALQKPPAYPNTSFRGWRYTRGIIANFVEVIKPRMSAKPAPKQAGGGAAAQGAGGRAARRRGKR